MARALLAHACLLATLIVAGAMPQASAGLSTPAIFVDGPACMDAGDDKGMGGTHISCRYSCGTPNLLVIGAQSSDLDATVYGNTECGNASASCLGPAVEAYTCAGVSEGFTNKTEREVKCSGHSDEVVDSPMLVACIATGASSVDAGPVVCEYAGIACPGRTGPVRTLLEQCTPTVDTAALLAYVVALADGLSVQRFVAFLYEPDGQSYVLAFEDNRCTSSSW